MIYKLAPKGSFHFGQAGIGIEETEEAVHSDTLFAAIASAWSLLGEENGRTNAEGSLQILEPFVAGVPPMKISSAFPYAGDILFLPRPLSDIFKGMNKKRIKSFKKVKYLSLGALEKLKEGDLPEENELIQDGLVWVTAEERERIEKLLLAKVEPENRAYLENCFRENPSEIQIWSSGEKNRLARVALDRWTSKTALYFQGQVKYAAGCGLYFWTEFADPAYQDHLEAALRFLADEGIGGRKSSGCGQFTWQRENVSLPVEEEPEWQMTLSLYHPTEKEIAGGILSRSCYELLRRCGWSRFLGQKDQRQRALNMFREGSIFPFSGSKHLKGTFLNVGAVDEKGRFIGLHPVWRYGLAFLMPIRLPEVNWG